MALPPERLRTKGVMQVLFCGRLELGRDCDSMRPCWKSGMLR